MKNFKLLLLIVIIASCKSDSERTNESIAGTWKLVEMNYTDSLGVLKTINDASASLTFLYDNKMGSSSGYEIIDGDTIYFEYSVDYEFDDIDIMLLVRLDSIQLPLYAIGRMQVYHFYKNDKKTIEFYTDFESEHTSTRVLKNPSYLYTKISDLPK
jgi:hypothetical protein